MKLEPSTHYSFYLIAAKIVTKSEPTNFFRRKPLYDKKVLIIFQIAH